MRRFPGRSHLVPAILLISVLHLCGCSRGSEPDTAADDADPFHPRLSSLPADDAVDHVLGMHAKPVSDHLEFEARLERRRRLGVSGVGEGDPSKMIGSITDATIGPDGSVFVLDGRNNHVKEFSAAGDPIRVHGREGDGPGELAHVEAMDVDEEGTVWVLDRRWRLTRFMADSTAGVHSFEIQVAGEDLCTMGGQIFVRGYEHEGSTSSGTVHVFSEQGQHVRSFGTGYAAENRAAAYRVSSEGSIACDRELELVLVGFRTYPVLYAYSPDGSLRWTSKIALDKLFQFEAKGDQLAFSRPEPGTQMVQRLLSGPSGIAVMQLYTVPHDPPGTYETYLLSAINGAGARTNIDGRPIYAVRDGTVLVREEQEFPQLGLYSF